jgi:hypothetical protein
MQPCIRLYVHAYSTVAMALIVRGTSSCIWMAAHAPHRIPYSRTRTAVQYTVLLYSRSYRRPHAQAQASPRASVLLRACAMCHVRVRSQVITDADVF